MMKGDLRPREKASPRRSHWKTPVATGPYLVDHDIQRFAKTSKFVLARGKMYSTCGSSSTRVRHFEHRESASTRQGTTQATRSQLHWSCTKCWKDFVESSRIKLCFPNRYAVNAATAEHGANWIDRHSTVSRCASRCLGSAVLLNFSVRRFSAKHVKRPPQISSAASTYREESARRATPGSTNMAYSTFTPTHEATNCLFVDFTFLAAR
mmetsp:Transcript_5910/g.16658  ORF Transcript_5910/g.16658 Transcript_5910/m.16658 type:complete len:209 (-) Transcript_5910:460-1086(-)